MTESIKTRQHAPVKILARDEKDLAVISMMTQDALVPLGDFAFLRAEKVFMGVINRFCWERPATDDVAPWQRSHAALRFEGVENVAANGLNLHDKARIRSLLAIGVVPPTPSDIVAVEKKPIVKILMHFSGGGLLALTAEGLICSLTDLGEPWPTQWKPEHQQAEMEPTRQDGEKR